MTTEKQRAAVVGLLSLMGTVVLAFATGLILWTVLPIAAGWSPTLVLTGSMTPSVQPGDVVVCSPVKPGKIRPGFVIRFQDPAQPQRYLLHRIARENGDGTLTTKGDANQDEDSTPVRKSAVTGMGRLRVPYVGLPSLWWRQGEYERVLLVVAVLFGLIGVTAYGWEEAGSGKRRVRSTPAR